MTYYLQTGCSKSTLVKLFDLTRTEAKKAMDEALQGYKIQKRAEKIIEEQACNPENEIENI